MEICFIIPWSFLILILSPQIQDEIILSLIISEKRPVMAVILEELQ